MGVPRIASRVRDGGGGGGGDCGGGGDGGRGRAGQRQSPAAAAAAAAAAAGDAQEHMPRLFSFVSTEHGGKQGVEAYFHGRYLVLEATGDDGARASAPFAAPIQLKRWTCVAVEYRPGVGVGGGSSSSASTAAAGEARLYVDGVLAESHPVSPRGSAGRSVSVAWGRPAGGDGWGAKPTTTVRAVRRVGTRVRVSRGYRRAARRGAHRQRRELRSLGTEA